MADLYISWSSTANQEVETAAKMDEPEMARRASSNIDNANMFIESWVLSSLGEMISVTGERGQAKIPSDHLDELADLSERYEKATDSNIAFGVGFEIHESDIALKVAETRHTEPSIVLYSEGVAEEARELEESKNDDIGPIAPDEEGALEGGAPERDGEEGELMKWEAPGQARPGEASKIEQGRKSYRTLLPSPPSPASSLSPPSATGQPTQSSAISESDQLRQAVASVLQDVKTNMGAIQQLQQTDPSAFQSVMGLVQAFVAVARQAFGEPIQKGEDVFQSLQKSSDYNRMGLMSPEGEFYSTQGKSHPDWAHDNRDIIGWQGTKNLDYQPEEDPEQAVIDDEGATALDHFLNNDWIRIKPNSGIELRGIGSHNIHKIKSILGSMAPPNAGRSLYVDDGGGAKHVPVSMTGRPDFSEIDDIVDAEEPRQVKSNAPNSGAAVDVPNNQLQGQTIEIPNKKPLMQSEHKLENEVAEESAEHPTLPKKTIEQIVSDHEKLGKDENPMSAPGPMRPGVRHELKLPVGTQLDTGTTGIRENSGKVKVRRADGSTAFVSVRAGQITSDSGHPISSRNPSGK